MDQNMCRLCNENIGVISLFESIHTGIHLCARVMYCTKVIIAEGDGLPANICVRCDEELESVHRFVLKCEETDKKLKTLEITPKLECEPKYDVKIEEVNDFGPDNASEEPFESIDNIKEECDIGTGVRIKRKYVQRSTVRKSERKVGSNNCKICGRLCNNPSTLAVHMRSHTNEKPHACLSCDKRYKDIGSLKRHTERNHLNGARKRSFICEQCGKGFFSKNDCKIHIRIHTGEMPYACVKCPARFTQVGTLQRHQLLHTGERPHVCSTCHKKFSTKEQLSKHYAVHTNEKKFQCPICDAPFKYSNNLKKHIKLHTEAALNKFTCNYCGRSYALKGNLTVHIKNQHSSKSGYCMQCAKHVSNMEMHMWRHTGERPLKCELCPSSFFDLKGLAHHINFRHKFMDKYKCTVSDCTLKFPSRPMLEYHITKYHKAVKPFTCDQCPRNFYRNSDLARHKKGSHNIKLD